MSETTSVPTDATNNGPTGFDRSDNSFIDLVLDDIGRSPTPYHAVEQCRALLSAAGFQSVDLEQPLPQQPGRYLAAQGGTLVAWIQQPETDNDQRHFILVGAHTDSPNLRVKSNPDVTSAGLAQVGVEVYGGVLLNSWLNRDLGLAGRVSVRTTGDEAEGNPISTVLINIEEPMLSIPQLAIHLDREITASGLKLNKQQHLTPMWTAAGSDDSEVHLRDAVMQQLNPGEGSDTPEILAWDLMTYDLQPPSRFGRHREFVASARIDNLLSAFCGTRALAQLAEDEAAGDHSTPVLVLYDHEEVGSESATGAAGNLLSSLLERIAYAQDASRDQFLTSLNRSIAISADGAHATHPNHGDKHDANHNIALNKGIVIKRNANQRYATDAVSESFILTACQQANVPVQQYIHRNDLPCGSTIGPITAARLGISTVDLGAPQLSMHSIRETAGTIDAIYLSDALYQAWSSNRC